MQEALVAAHTTWPRDGIPDNPRAWLLTAAARRLVDEQRSAQPVGGANRMGHRQSRGARGRAARRLAHRAPALLPPGALARAAVALTLRAVGGLTTAEIATAYVVPESTMAQRISRAKHPPTSAAVRPARVTARCGCARALAVLYLLYNEGYAASAGPTLIRADRSAEAIRLARLAHRLLPADPEVSGLLALMLLLDARRPARVTARATSSRSTSRTARCGTAARRRGHGAARRSLGARSAGPTRCRRPSPPCTTGPRRPRHRLAAGARALRPARGGGSRAPSSPWPGPSRWPRPRARTPPRRC